MDDAKSQRATYLKAVESEGSRLAELAEAKLAHPVPFLEDWTVRDLLAHTGEVYAFCAANVAAESTIYTQPGAEAAAPAGDEIVSWFRQRHEGVMAALIGTDPTLVAWTIAGVRTAGFWVRRMAHETAIHRWDVDASVHGLDAAGPIDSALARDGVDEYLAIGLQFSTSRPNRIYPAGSLHLHRTDGDGEWMLARTEDGTVAVTEEHGKGDAAVRGSASDLLLWIWGRPIGTVEVFGDESVARAWHELAP